MSAYVRSSVRAALYAGMTMTTLGSLGHGANSYPVTSEVTIRGYRSCEQDGADHERPAGRGRPACSSDSSAIAAPDPAVADRVPPGQYLTEKFPVLHYGSVPSVDLATWDFRVHGEVDNPFTLTWDEFRPCRASR